jgi:periplasmic protein TonB
MESGPIKAKSKYWPFVSLLVNGGGMIALIIWPLLHPEALPRQMIATLMVAPSPPPLPPRIAPAPKIHTKSELLSGALRAPSRIPRVLKSSDESAQPPSMEDFRAMEGPGGDTPGSISTIIGSIETGRATVANPAAAKKLSISSGVMAGNLLDKTLPQYPAIARAARIQGTVVLQAAISRSGLIQNLRVISGPPMLQQAAVTAVRSWRYKRYLLNGEPVEVETTINVVFSLGQ